MHSSIIRTLLLLCSLLSPITPQAGASDQQYITLSLPAPALMETIQSLLPLPIDPQTTQMQGRIILTSIDSLAIDNDLLQMKGVVAGQDIAVNTQIAGQNIQLKVGQIVLPVTCDLSFRFDRKLKKLYLVPHFAPPEENTSSRSDALSPLFAAIGNKEYALPLDGLQSFQAEIGNQVIPLNMEPISISGVDNKLILELQPTTLRKK